MTEEQQGQDGPDVEAVEQDPGERTAPHGDPLKGDSPPADKATAPSSNKGA